MLSPAIVTDIDDLVFNGLIGNRAIPPRMSPAFVEVRLIVLKLVLQVSLGPEECLNQ